MNTQNNLMMITIVISAIYGVWAIFAPGHIMEYLWYASRTNKSDWH